MDDRGSRSSARVHKDNPRSRIMTSGYDSSLFGAVVYMIRCFRDTARQLLDELVELRRGPDRVTVHILLIMEPSIGVRQRAIGPVTGYPSSTGVHHS